MVGPRAAGSLGSTSYLCPGPAAPDKCFYPSASRILAPFIHKQHAPDACRTFCLFRCCCSLQIYLTLHRALPHTAPDSSAPPHFVKTYSTTPTQHQAQHYCSRRTVFDPQHFIRFSVQASPQRPGMPVFLVPGGPCVYTTRTCMRACICISPGKAPLRRRRLLLPAGPRRGAHLCKVEHERYIVGGVRDGGAGASGDELSTGASCAGMGASNQTKSTRNGKQHGRSVKWQPTQAGAAYLVGRVQREQVGKCSRRVVVKMRNMGVGNPSLCTVKDTGLSRCAETAPAWLRRETPGWLRRQVAA